MHSLLKLLIVMLLVTLQGRSDAATPIPTTLYLERGAGRIAYDDSGGPGPLLLALPGMGDLRQQYRHLRPRLVQAGYRVVTLDVRGHGDSSVQWPDYSAEAVGSDAVALLRQLGGQPAYILGNSFAAGAGLWAGHEAPELVRGLVMLGPVLRDQPLSWWDAALLRLGFAGPWRVAAWLGYWDSLFPLSPPADHALYRAQLAAKLREDGRMDALYTMMQQPKTNSYALLAQWHQPTLVIMGSRDADFPDPSAEAAWIGQSLSQAQIWVLPGVGHYPHVEQPDAVAARLVAFLQQGGH